VGKLALLFKPSSITASVWHTPVAAISTNTSPARGGNTSMSAMARGWFGSDAMAAIDFIIIGSEGLLLIPYSSFTRRTRFFPIHFFKAGIGRIYLDKRYVSGFVLPMQGFKTCIGT
jgi:hypothetical protein